MRNIKGAGNRWQREGSNSITTSETTHENDAPVLTGTYDLTYHAKQFTKGLLVFGAGLLGYVGFKAFFASRREASTLETEQGVDGNLALTKESFLDLHAKIRGIPPSLEHQEQNGFMPTAFSTARTLLSLRGKEVGKGSLESAARAKDFLKSDKETSSLASSRRATQGIGYQGGLEFQVNTYTNNSQLQPAVTTLTEGGFMVVWASLNQDGDSYGVYGQRYNTTGLPEGAEFQVNTYTSSDQGYPAVTALPTGGFVVVWHSSGQDGTLRGVYGQRYNATGQPEGLEFQVNSYTTLAQWLPVVTAFPAGGFVVVWESYAQDGDLGGVYGQRYDSLGLPDGAEFQVNTYTASAQSNQAVAAFPAGGFVVVWHSQNQDGSGYGIYGQRYDSSGLAAGSEFRVNNYTTSFQFSPTVAAFPAGGFVVVWMSQGQDGDNYGVYGQRYNTMGLPEGTEFRVNTYTTSDQSYPAVATFPAGGFVVVWKSYQDSGYGVYGQRYNATGYTESNEFQVNTYTAVSQSSPSVSRLNNGSFVVVWSGAGNGDPDGIYGRLSTAGIAMCNNRLNIIEGTTVYITLGQLSASNMEGKDNELVFTINNIQNGRFETINQLGVAITSFTQQDIRNNVTKFVHDGSHVAPSYDVKVSDGNTETPYEPVQIVFFPINDPPQIINNHLEITRGTSVVLTPSYLSATDEDSNNNTLIFITTNTTHGRFENINNLGTTIITFTQQQIIDKEIQFTHDGTIRLAPSYVIKVSDGLRESAYRAGLITFYPGINLDWLVPVLITSSLLGACLCITAAGFCFITVGGIYVAKTNKNRKTAYDIKLEELSKAGGKMTVSPFLKKYLLGPKEIKLIKVLGQGAQAIVYLAKWGKKKVAYKLTSGLQSSAISDIEKEAKIMFEANFPTILRVYKICVSPQGVGLVMEYMQYGSLKEAMQKQSLPFTWEDKWNIVHDLVTAVESLHKQDVVHRDIKTDNLLLHSEEDAIHAKLADFGLSKTGAKVEASMTMGIGTSRYMAPETMTGHGETNEEDGRLSKEKGIDIYAIGMTLVALANEQEPYPDKPNQEWFPSAVADGSLWQEINDAANCPTAFVHLANKCRSKHPEDRPSISEIVEQVRAMEEEVVNFVPNNETLNQSLSFAREVELKDVNKKLPVEVIIAQETKEGQKAPRASQALFPVQKKEKRKSLDELKDILDRQVEKVQNGKFDDTDLGPLEVELEKFKCVVSDMRNAMAQQEQKKEDLNSSTANTVAASEPIMSDNKISV